MDIKLYPQFSAWHPKDPEPEPILLHNQYLYSITNTNTDIEIKKVQETLKILLKNIK